MHEDAHLEAEYEDRVNGGIDVPDDLYDDEQPYPEWMERNPYGEDDDE